MDLPLKRNGLLLLALAHLSWALAGGALLEPGDDELQGCWARLSAMGASLLSNLLRLALSADLLRHRRRNIFDPAPSARVNGASPPRRDDAGRAAADPRPRRACHVQDRAARPSRRPRLLERRPPPRRRRSRARLALDKRRAGWSVRAAAARPNRLGDLR